MAASRLESILHRLTHEARLVAGRPEELRVVAAAGGLAAFGLWLAIAWGEALVLAATALVALAAIAAVALLRRRAREEDDLVVPPIDRALLLARTRPPGAGALAPAREPRAYRPAQPLQHSVTSTERPAPSQSRESLQHSVTKSYEVHETAPGGTVLHRTCATLLAAADCALELAERHRGSAVEVVKVTGTERRTVLTFAGDRPVTRPDQPKSLLDTFGYPVTTWRARPE